jgi:hypothetical protein
MEAKQAAIPTSSYKDTIATDGISLAGSAPQEWNVTPEQMQEFKDNPNATAEQKAAALNGINAAAAAQGGVGFDTGGRQIVAQNGDVALANPESAVKRKDWEIFQDRAAAYLTSGKSEHMKMAQDMLKASQEYKSKDYLDSIVEARKQGLSGLLQLMHDHPNSELNIVNPKVEYDKGKAYLVGEDSQGNPVNADHSLADMTFDLKAGGSVEDQIASRLSSMVDSKAMLQGIKDRVEQERKAREEARAEETDAFNKKKRPLELQAIEQGITENKIKLDNLPTKIKLDNEKDRAAIRASQASTAHSVASTNKIKAEGSTLDLGEKKKLDDSVEETSQLVAKTMEDGGSKVKKTQRMIDSGEIDSKGNKIMVPSGKADYSVHPELRKQIETLTLNGISQAEITSLLGQRDAKGNSTALGIAQGQVGLNTSKGFLPLRKATKAELSKLKK